MQLRIFALLTLAVAAVTASMASDFTGSVRAQSAPPAPSAVLQPAPGHPSERTGNVIVRFKSGTPLASVAGAVASSQASVTSAPAGSGTVVVQPSGGQSVDDAIAALSANPNVEYAEADLRVSKALTPNDSYYATYQWNLPQISADTAWNTTTGGAGTTIAVVDTGVDGGHPDLNGKLLTGKNFINIPIASSTNASGSVRINTSAPHPYLSGDSIVIAGHNIAGVNGTWSIFAPRTNITLSSNSGGFVQITTSAAHGLAAGDMVNITGHNISAVNGHHTVVSTPSSTTFTIETAYGGSNGSASGAAKEASWFNLVGSTYGGVNGSASGTANEPTARDDDSHGTFVASIIAAKTNNTEGMAGVCWTCKILPVKVLDDTGNGNTSDVAAGIIWAADNGAKVINLSLGSASGNATLQNAVDYAWNTKNAVVVAATGNDNGPVLYPAAYPNALAIGANNQAGVRSSFSNFGSQIDLMAPGENVLGALCSCNGYTGGYGLGGGTSFATPHVAGVIGLLIGAGTTDKNTIVSRLKTTATNMDVAGFDNNTGWGRVNVAAALGDTTPPTVSITGPANGATVSGSSVAFSATASDAGGVQKVQFWAESVYLGYDTTAPYSKTWDTTGLPGGAYLLRARAVDMANNTQDAVVTVSVMSSDSTPPTVSITSPAGGATVSGSSVAFNANASDAGGIQKVQFWAGAMYLGYDATAPYGKTWDTTSIQNGRYTLRARAVDTANNIKDALITVTVINPDSAPPTISITSPVDLATVGGMISVTTAAADTQGLQKVQFWVDSTYLGYDAAAPYSVPINTASLSNGSHVIRARAVDWGNNVTDAVISVTVSN